MRDWGKDSERVVQPDFRIILRIRLILFCIQQKYWSVHPVAVQNWNILRGKHERLYWPQRYGHVLDNGKCACARAQIFYRNDNHHVA